MLEAMMTAPVGDDVYGEDETVNRLETRAAALFGMEAALFCPSGTMTNQIAIKAHTQPGDEVICDYTSHVYQYEGGGIASNSGCSVRLLHGQHGRLTAAQVAEGINNPNDIHKPISRLVSLENTANRGGGSCYPMADLEAIQQVCAAHDLAYHLDGARLFNALVANQQDPLAYGRLFHSISICLSKGLGAPVGSVLLGTRAFITKARRLRKVFGGGMRQAGILAAAGLYALDHHVERLAEDHARAASIAAALRTRPFVEDILPVETNIVIFRVANKAAAGIVDKFNKAQIRAIAMTDEYIRMVTHLDITDAMLEKTIQTIHSL